MWDCTRHRRRLARIIQTPIFKSHRRPRDVVIWWLLARLCSKDGRATQYEYQVITRPSNSDPTMAADRLAAEGRLVSYGAARSGPFAAHRSRACDTGVSPAVATRVGALSKYRFHSACAGASQCPAYGACPRDCRPGGADRYCSPQWRGPFCRPPSRHTLDR